MAQDRYSIIEKLDAGGMAEVYKGKASSLQGLEKIVAIKRILPTLTKNDKFIRMFLDEARLSMCLTHANIVQTFDVGKSDDTYFLVMEFVEGVNLKKMMEIASRIGKRIPVEISVFLAMEICKALAHAHEKRDTSGAPLGIVHRDVSPPNILISKDGEVKLTDFGLAKARSHAEITDPGVVKGKFAYLCPEVVEGDQVDPRADIFAMGIVLWEMLAGKRLFLGNSDMDTLALVRNCQIPSLRSINPKIPVRLEEVVLKSLAKNVEDRYQTSQHFGSDLTKVLFAHGMAVNAYDLAALLKTLMSDITPEPGPKPLSLIDRLIMEEMERFHSIDSTSGESECTDTYDGSRPLTCEDLTSPNDDLPPELAEALMGISGGAKGKHPQHLSKGAPEALGSDSREGGGSGVKVMLVVLITLAFLLGGATAVLFAMGIIGR